ncbi:MAG: protein kinase, partial [Myxococcales bacterium]|nr:protein kinase [Myxococcales bacterium]
MGGEAELGGLGQPLAAGDVRRGTILPGGYEVLDPIGSGGMGDVLLARALASGAKVAVKIIHGRSGERHLERFAREMRVARRIRHPNVVELLDHNQTADGVPFYVMEFLDGDDLATVLSREGALPWPRARAIMIQILHALAAAHERGVVHRDLKPSNCICVRSGAGELIKLVDFGIAKVSSDDPEEANLTRTGSVLGTPHYMSPEQAVGHEVDARADIYSAGVILFELLTGQVPFAGANPMGVLGRLITEAPPSPRHIAPEAEISPELEAIILRALAKRPEERFASATEFAEALRRVAGGPRRAAPTGIFRRPSRLYGRDEERAALLGAFNRAGAGERVCVLLSGDAGIGKSALVTDVLAHRAHLSAAKFDPESRDAPFVALLAVLRQLVGHALGQDDEARARLQRRLVSELGLGLPVVAQLLPELEALVGRQAPPAPASASASRNRLHAALLRLLAVDTHRVLLNLTRGAADRSIAVGLAALARAGIRVPDDPAERARECEVELAAIWAAIGERSIVEIADAPLCEDPETRAILRLLTELIAPAHMSAAGLADLLICKIVNLSLTRGSTDASAYGYVLFAFFLVTRRPQRAAHDFGRLALALNERLGDASQESRLHFVFGSILHLFAPLPEVLAHLERALVVGLEIGDHVFASYACSHALIALIGAGAPLDEVRERARAYLRVMGRTRVASSTAAVKIAGRVIACLLGECAGPTSLSGESFDEAAVIADLEAQNLGFPCLWYHVAKLALAYRAGDLDGARAAMVAGERRVFNLAWFISTEFFFYKCMVLAELARSAPAEVDLAALRTDADRLGECAALCPSSFTHKEAMVRAEL